MTLSAPSSEKRLAPTYLRVQELLEDLGVGELREHAELLVAAELDAVERALHAALQPAALLGILDERELGADGAAVGLLQARHDVRQRQRGRTGHVAGEEDGLRIDLIEAELGEAQLARIRRRCG